MFKQVVSIWSDIGMRVRSDRQFANESISFWRFQICASLFQFWDNLFKQKHPSPIIINYCVFFTESKRNSAIYPVSILSWMNGLKAVFLFTYVEISMHGNVVRGNHIMAAWCFNCRAAAPLDMGCIIVTWGQGPGARTASLGPLITGSLHYNYTITSSW